MKKYKDHSYAECPKPNSHHKAKHRLIVEFDKGSNMKTYARRRVADTSLDIKKGNKISLIDEILPQALYFEVTQPDSLDGEEFNVVIKRPFTMKNGRLKSIDLTFLTEDEMKYEIVTGEVIYEEQ